MREKCTQIWKIINRPLPVKTLDAFFIQTWCLISDSVGKQDRNCSLSKVCEDVGLIGENGQDSLFTTLGQFLNSFGN